MGRIERGGVRDFCMSRKYRATPETLTGKNVYNSAALSDYADFLIG
jgi:hypothetical protein